MVDFKKDVWLYALIAAILALIAIFTPAYTIGDESYWLGGIIAYDSAAEVWAGMGTVTLYTLGATLICITMLLFVGINTWRGKEFKWDWLMYLLAGIVMIIFPILHLVYDLESYMDISFAPIGILIAGIIAVAAFAVDKFVGRE